MYIWNLTSICVISASSYQCVFMERHNGIELASNPKASCCLRSLAAFLTRSYISSRLWSLAVLNCQSATLRHPAMLEAERALTFTFEVNSYRSLVLMLLHVLFNRICDASLWKYLTLVLLTYETKEACALYIFRTKIVFILWDFILFVDNAQLERPFISIFLF